MTNRSRLSAAIFVFLGLALGIFLFRDSTHEELGPGDNVILPQQVEKGVHPDEADGADRPVSSESGQPLDGTSSDPVTVVWRPRPKSALHWSEYQGKTYDELRALADAGDGRATAWLAATLAQCSNFPPPQSDAEIETAVEEMRRTHLVPKYANGVATMQDFNNHLDSLEANIEVYEIRARRCSTVPAEYRTGWEDWANRALSVGNMDDLAHGLLYGSMEKNDYVQLLNDLWDSGEPTALVSLSSINLLDYHEGTNPNGQVRQLAYQLAALRLLHDYSRKFEISNNDDEFAKTLSDEIWHLRGQMRPYEIEEAKDLAEEIIGENQNCCLVWPEHYFGDE